MTNVHTFTKTRRSESDNPKFVFTFDKGNLQHSIVFRKTSDIIFTTTDQELFKFIKDPMVKILSKLFENREPVFDFWTKNVNESTEFGMSHVEVIKALNFDEVEAVFFTLLLSNFKVFENNANLGDFIEIVKNHVEMFNDTVFDDDKKVTAALDPWNAQLGFENVELVKKSGPSLSEIKKLLADKTLLLNYQRLFYISTSVSINRDLFFEEITLESIVFSGMRSYKFCESFFSYPVDRKDFWEQLYPLKFVVVLSVFQLRPTKQTDDVLMQWLPHFIKSNLDVEGSQVDAERENLSKIAHTCFVNPPTIEELQDVFYSNRTSEDPFGFRELAFAYLESHPVVFNGVDELSKFFDLIGQLESIPQWLDELVCGDWLLTKLHVTLGAQRAVEAILRVIKDGASLTVQQWLKLHLHIEEMWDVPASWWGPLIGNDHENNKKHQEIQ